MKKTLLFLVIFAVLCAGSALGINPEADSAAVDHFAGSYYSSNSSTYTSNITNVDTTYTLAVAFRQDSLTASGHVLTESSSAAYKGRLLMNGDNVAMIGNSADGNLYLGGDIGAYDINATEWYRMIAVFNGSARTIYLRTNESDDFNKNSTDTASVATYDNARIVGQNNALGQSFNGYIYNVTGWNYALTASEVENWLECSETTTCTPANGTVNMSIVVRDAWNGSLVTGVSATINSTTYYNLTGSTIETPIPSTDSYEYTINISGDDHVERNFTLNATTTYTAYLYPANSLNITFKYEDTYLVANDTNITATFISSVYTVEYNTTNGTMNLTLPHPVQYQIRYQAAGYTPRFYTFTLTNGTYNELELLLPASTAQNVTVYVKDTLGNPLENATVKVLKFFPSLNSYVQVASVNTNFEGRIVESMEIGTEFYQFVIEYGGDTVLTTTPSYIWDDSLTLYVDLLGDVFSPTFARAGLYGIISFNGVRTFTYVYDDKDNIATQGCLYAYRTDWNTLTLANSSCGAGAAGTLSVILDNTTGYSYLLRGYITKDGENLYITSFTYTYGEGFVEDGNALLLVVIAVSAFALIGFWRIEAAVIFAGLSLFLVSLTGMVNIPITYTAGIFVLSIVTAFIISKRRGG